MIIRLLCYMLMLVIISVSSGCVKNCIRLEVGNVTAWSGILNIPQDKNAVIYNYVVIGNEDNPLVDVNNIYFEYNDEVITLNDANIQQYIKSGVVYQIENYGTMKEWSSRETRWYEILGFDGQCRMRMDSDNTIVQIIIHRSHEDLHKICIGNKIKQCKHEIPFTQLEIGDLFGIPESCIEYNFYFDSPYGPRFMDRF